jgi:uncharacterized membrane protein
MMPSFVLRCLHGFGAVVLLGTGGVARIMLTALFAAALAERGLLTIARLSAKVAGNERAER